VPLQQLGLVALPPHARAGGFDHAAVHEPTGHVYVAHTANDAVDVIDINALRYVRSIPGLSGVAGALLAGPDVIATSNRGENTVGVFTIGDVPRVDKIAVGLRPNGLAYDPRRQRLLVAHVGDPAIAGSFSVSIIDMQARKRLADIAVGGRTRWAVYDPVSDAFHVNIADPPQIAVVESGDPLRIRHAVPIQHAGPHGLDLDVAGRRLFCACDAGVLLVVDADTGAVLETHPIAGSPDVVFFNARLGHLYVAIGEPGVIEVFDTAARRRHEIVAIEAGAHTLAFDATRNVVCAFLPHSHRVAVYEDRA
jgi:DNA-binding beta-propeller fold protein YncE